jgi:hypothetical protein
VASTYDIGDVARCAVVFTLVDGSTADPTKVYFAKQTPDGAITNSTYSGGTTAIIRSALGHYYKDALCTGAGLYEYRFWSTGTAQAAGEGYFSVRARRVI